MKQVNLIKNYVLQKQTFYVKGGETQKKTKKGKKYMKDIMITKTNFNKLAEVGLESAEIYFIYENKNYVCKYEKNDEIKFLIYDENENLVLSGICKTNGESLKITKNNLVENEHDAKIIFLRILKEMIMNAKD